MIIDLSSGFHLPVKTDSGFMERVNLPQGYTPTNLGTLWAANGSAIK
jgi:hypothetical protein